MNDHDCNCNKQLPYFWSGVIYLMENNILFFYSFSHLKLKDSHIS